MGTKGHKGKQEAAEEMDKPINIKEEQARLTKYMTEFEMEELIKKTKQLDPANHHHQVDRQRQHHHHQEVPHHRQGHQGQGDALHQGYQLHPCGRDERTIH